ncbi:MAG: tRNA guanosine(34) transglycosylase Tgt, partial [archaeon]|nr:tRNA guanosine(34) transglycosylase Tgt [archaeon]
LHKFMNYDGNLLTDSGGFQMVSLLQLARIDEEGVRFVSPHNGLPMLLTPEHSIRLQNVIGADIIMQLDDVVHSCVTGPRVEEAMHRSIRWLDRCIAAHARPHDQNLFGIIQGGLDLSLRRACIAEMVARDLPGYAIGGLSGGESKDAFWRVVSVCTELLPTGKPRYLMGVGYAVDLVVASALGVDMFDCVYPSRTARFGTALRRVVGGVLNLKRLAYQDDLGPVDPDCPCSTCRQYSLSYIHRLFVNKHPLSAQLLTLHNIAYQHRLMADIRTAIKHDTLPDFVRSFFASFYTSPADYPTWCIEALASINIPLIITPA